MVQRAELLLVGAVAIVGVLLTIVPDHWVPITLIARQRGWSKAETARAALQAGTGHVLSTLAIALVVWVAGAAVTTSFGHVVDTLSSLALIAFGGWICVSAWRDLRGAGGHRHSHHHQFHGLDTHDGGMGNEIHGPELQRIPTHDGVIELSIFESGMPPHFRLTAPQAIEPPTPTLVAMSSSLAPVSAASKICARLSLRAACLPPLRSAVRSARSVWLSSTR